MISIAEGVESKAEAALLATMGCDFGQGWLYGRPVSADEIPVMFRSPLLEPPTNRHQIHESLPSCSNLEALPTRRLAQLRAIYDGVPVGLCFVDSRLRFVSINERLAMINNRSVAEHLGQPVADMVPHIFEQIRPNLQRALDGQAVHNLELQMRGVTPEHRKTLLANYQPAFDEQGEVVGVLVAVTDITSQKEAERARRSRELHFADSFHAAVRNLSSQVCATARPNSALELSSVSKETTSP
jgi:PAS domain S-box-containing protein